MADHNFLTDDDYEEMASRSYERSLAMDYELRSKMKLAMGDAEVTFVGSAREDRFYCNWTLVEDVLKELAGKTMVHLTINASYEVKRRYDWQGPNVWEITVTHMGGCYSRYLYTWHPL